jgi:glycine cleavage system H protein
MLFTRIRSIPRLFRSFTTYFSKDHEWIKVEGDKGRIGITAHAAESLGDIVFVELPQ